jgi:hypothetical protein
VLPFLVYQAFHARPVSPTPPVFSVFLVLFLRGRSDAQSVSTVFRIFFQVPYTATPLFATLTKTAGVCTNNSQNGTFRLLSEWNRPSNFKKELL